MAWLVRPRPGLTRSKRSINSIEDYSVLNTLNFFKSLVSDFFVLSDKNEHSLSKALIEEIFRELYPALVNYAVRFVGEVQTGKDLVQDSFVALWQNRGQVEIHTGIRSYLYRAVRNKALNYLRDLKNVDSLDEEKWFKKDTAELGLFRSGFGTEEGGENTEAGEAKDTSEYRIQQMKLVKRWIQELPDRQREAFELSRFDGLTHYEIAGVMAISEKTVNNHLIAALKSIRQKQQDHAHKLN